MSKWNLEIDISLCTNCNNCVVATKDEFMDNEFEHYSKPFPKSGKGWMKVDRHIRGSGSMLDVNYTPMMCNHCDDAPCINAAKDGAVYKRDDGIVIMDPVKSKGQKDIAKSCPYGVIAWNEEEDIPQTWFFDAHLLDNEQKEPRCVQACPTGAMKLYNCTDEAMADIVLAESLEVLHPEFNTKPRVYYKNLKKCRLHFIGGNVTSDSTGTTINVPNAKVELFLGDEILFSTASDAFGDFKFDDISSETEAYFINVSHEEHGHQRIKIAELSESLYLDIGLR